MNKNMLISLRNYIENAYLKMDENGYMDLNFDDAQLSELLEAIEFSLENAK